MKLIYKLLIPARPEHLVGISMAPTPEITRRLKRVLHRLDTSPLTRRAVALFFLFSCVSITTLAGLRVVHAGEANLPPAKTITPADVPPGARVLHFPADRVMGKVFINGRHYDRGYYYGPTANGWDEYDWEYLAEARGDVLIPAGKLVKLEITSPAIYRDLTPLKQLGPNDIHHLRLGCDIDIPGFPAPRKPPAGFNPDALLQNFTGLTGLKVLDIRSTYISERSLGLIQNFTSLERLYPPQAITPQALKLICGVKSLKGLYALSLANKLPLAELGRLGGLEELWVYGAKHPITEAQLEPLASQQTIKFLQIGCPVQDRAMRPVSRMASLEKLSVRSSISDAGLRYVAASRTIEELEVIDSDQITNAGVSSLMPMPSLRILEIGNAKLTNKSAESLSRIKTLEKIECDGNSMNDEALIALARLPRLRSIQFSLNHFVDPAMNKPLFTKRGLTALAEKTTLEELKTGGSGIDDAALAQIGRMTRLRKLQIFPLITATNAGLARLSSLQSLEELFIGNWSDAVTFAGLKQMSPLPNLRRVQLEYIVQDNSGLDLSGMPKLESLLLGVRDYQSLRDDDLKGLAGLKHMRHLHLHSCALVTDRGLNYLSGLTSLSNGLELSECKLTDAGLKSLAGMQQLGRVAIGGNITDAGLAELAKLKTLQGVTIHTTGLVSPQGVDQIKSLPFMQRCQIGPANVVAPYSCQMPVIGQDAPDLTLTTLDGKQIKLSSIKKIVMLHFWSTWDRNCLDQAELARLRQVNEIMSKKYPGKFVLVSVALDDNDALWRGIVGREGMSWFQARGHQAWRGADLYGFNTMPAYYLLNGDGKVLLNPESSWKNIDAVIEKALK